LNIFYNGEYNINGYSLLIINERSKQYVLAVLAAWQHFLGKWPRELPSVKSRPNQPAL
jgi:hypothetical protein